MNPVSPWLFLPRPCPSLQDQPKPHPPPTCHADAGELANSVKTCGLVATGPRQTLIDIRLTSRSSVATAALTQERALCVHTPAQMFAGIGTCGVRVPPGWAWPTTAPPFPCFQTHFQKVPLSPMEHSSTSWSHAPPVKPGGQVQMARPLTGFVSQIASSWQGLLTQASSR